MRSIVLVLTLFLAACAHTPRGTVRVEAPDGGAGLPWLAVLPAPDSDPDAAARSLAGASVVFTALEAQQPAAVLKDLEALARAWGPEGTCLLEPAWTSACLDRRYQGDRLEVRLNGDRLELTFHPGPRAASRPAPVPLAPLEAGLPVERLGPALMEQLGLARAPAPRDAVDQPPVQQGTCLEPAAAPAFGHGLRALMAARLEGETGRETSLARALEQLVAAHTRSPTPLVAAWLAEARLAAGDLSGAFQALPVEMPPRCGLAPALAARARLHQRGGDPVEAAADLARSARLRPYSDDALEAWADSLTVLEQYPEAARVLRRVLVLTPRSLDRRRRLSDLQALSGQPKEARAVLIEGLEHLPAPVDRAWLELDLGHLAENDAQWRQAALHYERGLQLLDEAEAPALRSALLNGEGVAYVGLEELDRAELALEEAVAIRRLTGTEDPAARRKLANSLYNLGTVKARLGKWRQAMSAMLEAAGLYDGDDRLSTWIDLARLLQQGAMGGSALDVLEEARRNATLEGPLEAEWWYIRGLSLAATDRLEEGMESLATAAARYAGLEQPLEEGLAWFNLGIVAERAGEKDRARESWHRARTLADRIGDRDSIEEIDRRLEALDVPSTSR